LAEETRRRRREGPRRRRRRGPWAAESAWREVWRDGDRRWRWPRRGRLGGLGGRWKLLEVVFPLYLRTRNKNMNRNKNNTVSIMVCSSTLLMLSYLFRPRSGLRIFHNACVTRIIIY